jgi:hypothetical protein
MIEAQVFQRCSQLTTVQLHEGLEEIGRGAFCGCTNLRAILILPSISVIDRGAFGSFTKLETVELRGELVKIRDLGYFNHA